MELYDLPQGMIAVACCDENRCPGTLELDPHEGLEKHKRPVEEQLIQLHGSCVMKLFDGETVAEVRLDEGDTLDIPADTFHAATDPTDDPSVTMWRFDGDIRSIVEDIRDEFRPV